MGEALKFEELRVLQAAEAIADGIWRQVVPWSSFARDTVGGQLVRATDSIGANIAESFGRFHWGEKLQFLYYARGSLFEAKYWLNRALARELMPSAQVQDYVTQLTDLACQLNNFSATLKTQRRNNQPQPRAVREAPVAYAVEGATDSTLPAALEALLALEHIADWADDFQAPLFTGDDLTWLGSIPNTQYPAP
jgi:four helix bundle protein